MINIKNHTHKFITYYTSTIYDYLNPKLEKACNDRQYQIRKNKNLKYGNEKELLATLKYIQQNLTNIIQATPDNLKLYTTTINMSVGKRYRKSTTSNPYKIHSILSKIFINGGYDTKICKDNNKELAYKIISELKLKTCPYCNRNYITSKSKSQNIYDKTTRPQLDHFLSKSNYPFLACSLYNLIPSCATCNLLKSDTIDDNLISPFNINNNDFKFKYALKKDFVFGKSNIKSIELKIENFHSNKKAFLLEELYQDHRDIVDDILHKTDEYSTSFINSFYDFKKSNGEKIISIEDVFNELYSEYLTKKEVTKLLYNFELDQKNFHKRPLSKLTYDILNQIINKKND